MLTARLSRHATRSARSSVPWTRQYSHQPFNRIKPAKAINPLLSTPFAPRISNYAASSVVSIGFISGRRFQSTDKTAGLFQDITNNGAVPTVPQGAGSQLQEATSNVFDQLTQSVQNTAEIAPHWGMLREAGLNFGWTSINPSTLAQTLIESMYVGAGLPWWAALGSVALIYRVAFFYPMIKSTNMSAVAAAIGPAQREIKARYEAMTDLEPMQRMVLQQKELTFLAKSCGYSLSTHLAPIFLQGILSFGIFRVSRALSVVPDIGLSNGGFLWLSNLHFADPYYILPLAIAATMHGLARITLNRNRAAGASPMAPQYQRYMDIAMLYAMPALMFAIMFNMPGAVQIPMSVLSVSTAASQLLLNAPSVRNFLGMTQAPKNVRRVLNVKGRTVGVNSGVKANGPRAAQSHTTVSSRTSNIKAQAPKQTISPALKQFEASRRKRLREEREAREIV